MQHSQCNTGYCSSLKRRRCRREQRRHTQRSNALPPWRRPHLVDGEHVEVGDVVFMSVLDPGSALLLVDQLSNVLVDELAL